MSRRHPFSPKAPNGQKLVPCKLGTFRFVTFKHYHCSRSESATVGLVAKHSQLTWAGDMFDQANMSWAFSSTSNG